MLAAHPLNEFFQNAVSNLFIAEVRCNPYDENLWYETEMLGVFSSFEQLLKVMQAIDWIPEDAKVVVYPSMRIDKHSNTYNLYFIDWENEKPIRLVPETSLERRKRGGK